MKKKSKLYSTDYYIKREQRKQLESIKEDNELRKQIREIHERELIAINHQIDVWLSKYAANEQMSLSEVRKEIEKIDIDYYKAKAKEYVKDKNLSETANKEMALYNLTMKVSRLEYLSHLIKLEAAKYGTEEEDLINSYLDDIALNRLKDNMSILGETIPSEKILIEHVEAVRNETFKGNSFSDNLWNNKRNFVRDLERGISTTLLRGESPLVWAKNLKASVKETGAKATYVAERLAVTEASIVAINANKKSFIESGYDLGIIIVEPGACKNCKPHSNKIVDLEKAKMGVEIPIWHPWCKCSVSPYINDDYGIDNEEISSGYIDKVYPITQKAINDINVPKIENLSEEENKKLKDIHKELLTIAKNENESKEVAFKMNSLYEKPTVVFGTGTELDLGFSETKFVFHNHPNNEWFSNKDLAYFVTHKKTQFIGMIKNNGKAYFLEKTEEFDFEKYFIIYNRGVKKYKQLIANNQQLGYNKVVDYTLKNFKGINIIGE